MRLAPPDQHGRPKPRKPVHQRRIEHRQARHHHRLVDSERGFWRQNIDIEPQPPERRIPCEHQFERIEVAPLPVGVDRPAGFVGKEQRHRSRRCAHRADGGEIGGGGARFMSADIIGAIGAEQPGVVRLLPERRLTPAEIADQFSTVRGGLQRPQPHHAGERGGVMRRPVHRTRLLLHHPPALTPGTAAIEIMVERGDIGMALPRITQLVVVRKPQAFEEADRIAVPPRDIEIGGNRVVIELGEEAHEIMDDIAPG